MILLKASVWPLRLVNYSSMQPTMPEPPTALLDHIRELASASLSLKRLQEDMVSVISQRLPYYHWVGFYMLDPSNPETLVLGPFAGEPTPHVRIPIHSGICVSRGGFALNHCRRQRQCRPSLFILLGQGAAGDCRAGIRP